MRHLVLAVCLALLPAAAPLWAQGLQQGVVQAPILTVESERMFNDSAFGQRVSAEIEAKAAEIAAENRRIESELTAEERDLTARRPSMTVEEFRAAAAAFDEKVQRLRREQDSKASALGTQSDEVQRNFRGAAQPVLAAILRDAGALLIVERRSVLLSVSAIDVTNEAIARINDAIGDGRDLMAPIE